MRILPILFNTEMVRGLQDNTKTATRRVIKYSTSDVYKSACFHGRWYGGMTVDNMSQSLIDWYCKEVKRPPYEPGDILYVRETWAESAEGYAYKADFDGAEGWGWRPSIHMPKEAARIFLKVTDVRVERLHDITEEQAVAEGARYTDFGEYTPPWKMSVDGGKTFHEAKSIHHPGYHFKDVDIPDQCFEFARSAFANYWGSTIKPADRDKYGWGANPWVWVIEFERTGKPVGWPHGKA